MKNAISPTRGENFAEWYQQVIVQAELAETSPTRGCMVIRPWGYGIWENIQRELDHQFKQTGHLNAYFPMLIPLSYFQKEAEHVDGFAKECAVVTHHRLEQQMDGTLCAAGELEEPLVMRPTSEMLIGASFSKWVNSYRDLPLLINQWANVLRWEMRPRIFLRTSEFLWQEGHTVHASKEEALAETLKMLDIYERFCHDHLALPVIKGEKCSWERFPGAVSTYTIEAMMQDGKALQAGTSHFLGQNFAKASNIKFINKTGVNEFAWTTSWGVSTRLIGAVVMTHGDDDGMVVPPLIAPIHIVIVPIIHREKDVDVIDGYCETLKEELSHKKIRGQRIRVSIDKREMNGGEKRWYHVKRGVPIIVAIGKREIDGESITFYRRDNSKECIKMSTEEFIQEIANNLIELQTVILNKAKDRLSNNTKKVSTLEAFKGEFKQNSELNPFVIAPFIEDERVEKILGDLGVTVRCLPLEQPKETAICPFTGEATATWALYAKSY